MPIYEFQCAACGHEYEHLRKSMHDADPRACPQCKSPKLRKKMSLFAPAARDSQPVSQNLGGCGRCGDPDGPCS